jgi:hypothetical protein
VIGLVPADQELNKESRGISIFKVKAKKPRHPANEYRRANEEGLKEACRPPRYGTGQVLVDLPLATPGSTGTMRPESVKEARGCEVVVDEEANAADMRRR